MWLFRLLMLYSVFGSYLYYCPDSTDSPLHLVYRSSTESKPSNSHSLSVFPKTSFLNDTVISIEQSGSSIGLQLQIQEFNNQSETVGYDYNHSLTELPKVSLLQYSSIFLWEYNTISQRLIISQKRLGLIIFVH